MTGKEVGLTNLDLRVDAGIASALTHRFLPDGSFIPSTRIGLDQVGDNHLSAGEATNFYDSIDPLYVDEVKAAISLLSVQERNSCSFQLPYPDPEMSTRWLNWEITGIFTQNTGILVEVAASSVEITEPSTIIKLQNQLIQKQRQEIKQQQEKIKQKEEVIDQQQQKLAENDYKREHDTLTGLYNRAYFERRISEMLTSRTLSFALIVIDLDGFSEINNTLGHLAGDEELARVSKVFTGAAQRVGDAVGRWAGDEFYILLQDIKEESELIGFYKRFDTACRQHDVKCSYGHSISGEGSKKSREQLFNEADAMMYQQKNDKKM